MFPLEDKVSQLEEKIVRLLEQHLHQKQICVDLLEVKRRLEVENQQLKQQVAELKRNSEQTVHRVQEVEASAQQERADIRQQLDQHLRDLDDCIAWVAAL